jgi:two-component system, LytTR family, sensor kinase
MEYDNDRLRKPVYRTETFYWIFLVLMNTLVNAMTLFFADPRIWPVILGVNLLLFPAYLLYSKVLGPFLFFRKRWGFSFLMSLLSMLVIEIFLFAVYVQPGNLHPRNAVDLHQHVPRHRHLLHKEGAR